MSVWTPSVRVWIVAALLGAAGLHAEEPAPRWLIRTDLLVVEVSQPVGLVLRGQLQDDASVAQGVSKLFSMINSGEAKLIGTTTLWCPNGEQAVSESVEEIRYGTDFHPAHPPQNFEPRLPTLEEEFRWVFYIPSKIEVPVAFETRNAGVTLEVVGTASAGGQIVSLMVVAQNVKFRGEETPRDKENANWRHRWPRFHTHRISTQFTTKSGAWKLLSVNAVNENKPALEFMVIRATAIPAG